MRKKDYTISVKTIQKMSSPTGHKRNLYILRLISCMHVHIAEYSYECYNIGHYFPSKSHI